MTRRALAPLAAALCLTACAQVRPQPGSGALTPGTSRHAFDIPGHGRLLLLLPEGWTAIESEEGESPGPGIRLEKKGQKFVVLLSTIWNPGEPEPPQARVDTARLFAELGRRTALAGAVEQDIPLEELDGPDVHGAYFSATDGSLSGHEVGPDEYRHVLQGAAAVGPLILAFSVLDDEPGPWREQALEVVRGARHAADGEGEAGPEKDIDAVPEGQTSPLRLRWPGKPWALLVDLGGFRVGLRPAKAGPPYAIGLHPDTGIAASVSLVPAKGATDARACRERALAAIAHAYPGISARRSESAEVARASYDLKGRKSGIPESHAHVFLYRDGVCASVHASKIGPVEGDGARIEEILSSVRWAEDF